jgi:hypothetical protein
VHRNPGTKNCELPDEDARRICDERIAFEESEPPTIVPPRAVESYLWSLTATRRSYGKAAQEGPRLSFLLLSARPSGAGGSLSESRVKRGERIVHGDKELVEKLGRNDPCPCGSGRLFQAVLPAFGTI